MAMFDINKAYDGTRLTTRMRAGVHQNGNLMIPQRVAERMGITVENCLLVCPLGKKDFAVVVAEAGREHGFVVRRTGPYYYTPFRSILTEVGVDFVHNRVIFDIIETSEKFEGRSVYKFNRRMIAHGTAEDEAEGEDEADAEAEKDADVAGEIEQASEVAEMTEEVKEESEVGT